MSHAEPERDSQFSDIAPGYGPGDEQKPVVALEAI
jgi:hypothetical protein